MNPEQYGDFYWCVKTPLSENGEVYVHADRIEYFQGVLILVGHHDVPVLSFAAGQWLACFAASVLDGAAVAVAHWKGEVSR